MPLASCLFLVAGPARAVLPAEDDALKADHLAEALRILDADPRGAADRADVSATTGYLRGAVLAALGRPAEAFAAFALGADARRSASDELAFLSAGLAQAGMLDLVAYLPAAATTAADIPDVVGAGPWALWAQHRLLRFRLAAASIAGDAAGVSRALVEMNRTTFPRGPARIGASPDVPTRRSAGLDIRVGEPSEALLAFAWPGAATATVNGAVVLDEEPALGGPSEHWVHLRLSPGTHRLAVEVEADDESSPEFDLVTWPRAAVRVGPAEPTEVSTGVSATVLSRARAPGPGGTPVDTSVGSAGPTRTA
ncbi:MAG: hypothetical protein QME96_17370, partial [Myxococcota bacterium]|nr:hypothetical protein [Myxococcota bacterium]